MEGKLEIDWKEKRLSHKSRPHPHMCHLQAVCKLLEGGENIPVWAGSMWEVCAEVSGKERAKLELADKGLQRLVFWNVPDPGSCVVDVSGRVLLEKRKLGGVSVWPHCRDVNLNRGSHWIAI